MSDETAAPCCAHSKCPGRSLCCCQNVALRREVIHDRNCGVPTGRTWACACNERNGYRPTPPGSTGETGGQR